MLPKKLNLLIWVTFFAFPVFSQTAAKVVALTKTNVFTKPLSKGESDLYSIHLQKNEYARIVALQRNVDISLTVRDPAHTIIDVADIPTGDDGNEYVDITANQTGDYFISVKALNNAAGTYSIKIEELLSADQNKKRLQLQKACTDSSAKYFSQRSLLDHIKILSSDSFQGRRPGTIGEKYSIDYLQNQYIKLGLEPGNGGSYFQDVVLPAKFATTYVSPMIVSSGNQSMTFQEKEDFVLFPHFFDSIVTVKNAPVVFAGYGIVSAKYNRDDYKNVDVNNKIVLLLRNPPQTFDDSLGTFLYKNREAAKRGALGCLYVFDSAQLGYAFKTEYDASKQGNFIPDSIDATKAKQKRDIKLDGDLTLDAVRKIFAFAGIDTALLATVDATDFQPALLPVTITVDERAAVIPAVISKNVIAKITGSLHPDEYIIYSGHWDHLGISIPDPSGDSICNGAWDNATGASAVLELARAFKNRSQKPERTIVFINFTNEEFGLRGSLYYAAHPVFPLASTLANINLDGLNILGRANNFCVYGTQLSTLEDFIKGEAAKQGKYFTYDSSITFSIRNTFYFSDNYNFALAGIPSVFSYGGSRPLNMTSTKLRELSFKIGNAYHHPSDQYDERFWNLDGAIEDLFVLYRTGEQLAASKTWPQWKPGAPFERKKK